MVKADSEARQIWTPAGVSVGETDAPTESAATSRDGRAGGDYVVHEIRGQDLDGEIGRAHV